MFNFCWHKWSKWSVDSKVAHKYVHGEEIKIVQVRKCQKCDLIHFKTDTLI
jgi:hypothetical protein